MNKMQTEFPLSGIFPWSEMHPTPPRYNEAQKVIGSRGGSKTPATPKMEFFVTLVDGWRPQTNYTTETFILVVAMVLDT